MITSKFLRKTHLLKFEKKICELFLFGLSNNDVTECPLWWFFEGHVDGHAESIAAVTLPFKCIRGMYNPVECHRKWSQQVRRRLLQSGLKTVP